MRFTWLEFADAKIRVSDLFRNRGLGTRNNDTSDIVLIS